MFLFTVKFIECISKLFMRVSPYMGFSFYKHLLEIYTYKEIKKQILLIYKSIIKLSDVTFIHLLNNLTLQFFFKIWKHNNQPNTGQQRNNKQTLLLYTTLWSALPIIEHTAQHTVCWQEDFSKIPKLKSDIVNQAFIW